MKTQHPGGHTHFHPFAEAERCLASAEFETEPKVKGIKKITTITLSAASMLVSDPCLCLISTTHVQLLTETGKKAKCLTSEQLHHQLVSFQMLF